MVGPGEQLLEQPEVCVASAEAVAHIARPLLIELAEPNSVLREVITERMFGLPITDLFSLAPLLTPDPSKSGVIVERWRLQEGKLPNDASDDKPEKMVQLWAANAAKIPKLAIPEGSEDRVMDLSDRMQLRGGGPVIYAREEVDKMPTTGNTLLHVVGAANKANRERVQSTVKYAEVHNFNGPIVATVNPLRTLREKERETVAGFAPQATNELELFVDSAIDIGFMPLSADNRYGTRFLEDGSAYLEMQDVNGNKLLVLAPVQMIDENGLKRTGVFNAYQSLINNQERLGSQFDLSDKDVIHITSSHYGGMAVMNNLRAVDDLRLTLGSFRVIGDNQPTRTAQAHLIEAGFTLNSLIEAFSSARLRDALLPQLEDVRS